MNRSKYSSTPHMKFEIHQINLTEKNRDSPTSSILKTPTAIFVSTRSALAKTKRLKFANGPVDLTTLKNGTHESNTSFDSGLDSINEKKLNNNGEISSEESIVEVAISPVKTMQVSPESWKAFLEYKKYSDYANETEKTDYTYSRLSKFRHKEIIPGFLIRPNLSRSSISSRRSSYSLPSNQSSFNEFYSSGSYEFNNQSNPEITHFLKTSSQPNKFMRSKYYLRSSSLDWKDTGETDSNAQNYLEKDYYVHSPSDNITKSYSYSTTELPEPINTPYYGKVRSMDFDDADIDVVDINPVHSEKHYYTNDGINVDRFGVRDVQPQAVSNYFTNFFTTVFLYITSIGTLTKDLFSTHILRRTNDWNRSPSALYDWRSDFLNKSSNRSWIPWKDAASYSTESYYSGGYYRQPRNWYQKIYYYFYDKVSQLSNFIWGNTTGYYPQRYYGTPRKRRYWWFLIPLLLFTGSFLGFIDFFSNPKAILNTMYNWALFIPSFLHYTAMVFIPWLIFEAVPYLILKAIPNFVTVTLPYFILNTVPYYFWVVVHFFAGMSGMSFADIWNMLVGAFNFALNFLMSAWGSFYNIIVDLTSSGFYLFKAEQENGFLSNQYKELDCRTNGFLTSVEDAIKPVWRSGYVAYKRAANSVFCYVNDSCERLKLPFTHINEWFCSKFSSLSEGSFSFLFTPWNILWQGLWSIFSVTRDAFSNLCLLLLNVFTDFLSAVNNMLYYISKYFVDIFLNIIDGLGAVFASGWKLLTNTLGFFCSYLYLLVFAPQSETKYVYTKPELKGEACQSQQKSIDKLMSEIQDFKSIPWDLSLIKKKIDDLEAELRKEKDFRRNQNEMFDKQLDQNHKEIQKYQTTVNYALHSPKRPAHLSSSSVQYLLDNQSDSIKQWITQNFLLKSDTKDLDEGKIALLISKYGNRTGEELMALKHELKTYLENHRSELETLRNNFKLLEGNNIGGNDISLAFIKKLISDAIKLYDADKTGRVDYALETAGGQVQSIRCTETFVESPKSYILMGWTVYTEASSPREAIRPGMAAGQCWAFVGSQGFLVLQLSHTIRVTGFTMEHISKLLVPRGHIESAPRNFSVWGLKHEHDMEPYLLGEYIYLDNDETLQYFPVTYPTNEQYNMVELKITSNHGNPNYTCLYRIRVHGDLDPIP